MPGLYIHIPFCKRKCRYCDFVSFPDYGREDLYFVALVSEIRKYSPLMRERVFDTVFIGGVMWSAFLPLICVIGSRL